MKRNTHQQKMVLDTVLQMSGTHPNAQMIYEQVRQSIPSVSRTTVYRILNQIAKQGEIQRVRVPSAADIYDARQDVHHHMFCDKCGRVVDIDISFDEDINSAILEYTGHNIIGYTIVFNGFCPKCGTE